MEKKRNPKIVKMKRKPSYGLGLFLILFSIYVLFHFIQSFTRDHMSIYEVTQKQMADNENVRGIILREEKLVRASQDGYINYYVTEGSKLSASTTVYSVSADESLSDAVSKIDTNDVTLSEDDSSKIRSDISEFRNDFSLSEYGKLVNFRYNIENTLLELSDISLAKNLNKLKKTSQAGTFELMKAKETGIISFCSDGLEELDIDTVTKEHFQEMTDSWKQLRTNAKIKKGQPVYRVVTDEKWAIIVKLSKEQYMKLLNKKSVGVKIKKDNLQLTPQVNTYTSDGNYYVKLIFEKYAIRYLNHRYLDVEIQFDNANGLKIPISSILQKKCYVIPRETITTGSGTSSQKGVMIKKYQEDGTPKPEFVPVSIYFEDENGNVYISADTFAAGTILMNENGTSQNTFEVSKTKELDGVYSCNQGYCSFKYIEILNSGDEYAIVKAGNSNSISNYEHIVLNPENIEEDDIIY